MPTRRDHEEALLADMLQPHSGHRSLLARLVELDTFQEVDATPDRPSLVELALRQLNRSIHPSPEMAPFLQALLARTPHPFQPGQPFAIAQQALIGHQDAVVMDLLAHPEAPPRDAWHAAPWTPAKRTHPSDWTWPVALARLSATRLHPSLAQLFQEGWTAAARPEGTTWLAHITATHLKLVQRLGHVPTAGDRAIWAQRLLEGSLMQKDLEQFTALWGVASVELALPEVPVEETLLRLLKAGPSKDMRAQLDALSTPECHWSQRTIKDRGPNNKQTTWSPIGWILNQALRATSNDYTTPKWESWNAATDLVNQVVPDRQAAPGVTEGGLLWVLSNGGKIKELLPVGKETSSPVQFWQWAVETTEAFFCKGEYGAKQAPALPQASVQKFVYFWREAAERRYNHQLPSELWAPWLERLLATGMGVPQRNAYENNRRQEDFAAFVIRLANRDEVAMSQRQGLLLSALATDNFHAAADKSLCDALLKLVVAGGGIDLTHPAWMRLGKREGFQAFLTSQVRQKELQQRPPTVTAPRPRRRS